MSHENWQPTWARRSLSCENRLPLEVLLRMDGCNPDVTYIDQGAWRAYARSLIGSINLHDAQSIIKVGCTAGAFPATAPAEVRGTAVNGIDYASLEHTYHDCAWFADQIPPTDWQYETIDGSASHYCQNRFCFVAPCPPVSPVSHFSERT